MTAESDSRRDGQSERNGRGVSTFRDLIAWQKARVLVRDIYQVTKTWPTDERFGLTNQIRRASVSIASNIAEGQGRTGQRELLHHLSIAHGSLREVQAQLILAGDLAFSSAGEVDRLLDASEEVGRLIRGLMLSLERRAGVREEESPYDAGLVPLEE